MKVRVLERLSLFFIPLFGWMLIQVMGRTWRFTTLRREEVENAHKEGRPLIYALWHGRMLPLIYLHRKRRVYALVSQHRDGELAARTAHLLGFGTVRGSSTRGGIKGFQDLLKKVTTGFDAVIMPDGPRGPARKVQQGVLRLAQLSGRPIIPITVSASRHYMLKSWDRFIIPKPFSRCVVVYGAPLSLPADASQDLIEEKRTELEECLNRITDEADAFFN
jgi:lysophospholipid acyltransferase (LPLAT)-like uncharacterized protein